MIQVFPVPRSRPQINKFIRVSIMEERRRKTKLLFFFLIYLPSLFKVTNNEEIAQKYSGREIKILAYQVIDIITVSQNFVNFLVHCPFFLKFPPFFSYKKHKDGNYTFEGLAYEFMQDAQSYLNFR